MPGAQSTTSSAPASTAYNSYSFGQRQHWLNALSVFFPHVQRRQQHLHRLPRQPTMNGNNFVFSNPGGFTDAMMNDTSTAAVLHHQPHARRQRRLPSSRISLSSSATGTVFEPLAAASFVAPFFPNGGSLASARRAFETPVRSISSASSPQHLPLQRGPAIALAYGGPTDGGGNPATAGTACRALQRSFHPRSRRYRSGIVTMAARRRC